MGRASGPAANVNPANMAKRMPAILASIEGGGLNELNDYHKELHRRIFNPDTPAIMELKKPERKKPAPLPEGAKKVSVLMFKGCTDEMTDKKVIINEVAPHVYTYTYKLKGYGERVKIIFEIDGVYFQGADNGAYVMEREDFNEICTKAYEHARENVADGAAKGMQYFVEVQKRIDAATPAETPQNSTETAVASNVSAKEENTAETAKYRISRFGGYKIIIGNREQGRVIAILMSVNGHNTIEISDESASIATMGEEPLQIDKPIMQLSDAEVLKLIYGSTEPPQSPATPQTIKHTTRTDKPRETARKEPRRTISKMERIYSIIFYL